MHKMRWISLIASISLLSAITGDELYASAFFTLIYRVLFPLHTIYTRQGKVTLICITLRIHLKLTAMTFLFPTFATTMQWPSHAKERRKGPAEAWEVM
jgi:hypothetical protein